MIVHDQFHHLWDAKTFLGVTRRFHLDSRKECSNGLDMRHILSCRKAEMFTPMLKGHKGRCFHLTKKIGIVQLETVDVKVQILYQPCESFGLLPKESTTIALKHIVYVQKGRFLRGETGGFLALFAGGFNRVGHGRDGSLLASKSKSIQEPQFVLHTRKPLQVAWV